MRWWDWVSPQGEQEMIPFLRVYMGKGKQFRTPKRMWEDLWMRKRGDMNHVMGMRKAVTITNFKGPKYQRGILHPIGFWAADGVIPNLQDIAHADSSTAPTPSRQQYAYDSNGSMQGDLSAQQETTIVYTDLTDLTDDPNDHTNDWWPDQPETNEGLNWEIRWRNVQDVGPEPYTADHLLADNTGVDRNVDEWYNLDTVSNDHADATHDGGIGVNRQNGTIKTPDTGLSTMTVDVEIGTDGAETALTSHSYDLDVEGT